jgi:hypothetical protein
MEKASTDVKVIKSTKKAGKQPMLQSGIETAIPVFKPLKTNTPQTTR